MASTETKVRIPNQYQRDQPRTPNEILFDEVEIKLEEFGVPKELLRDLSDYACFRVNDAYDFGVAWGLGQFPEIEFQGPREALIEGLRGAIRRLDTMVEAAAKEMR